MNIFIKFLNSFSKPSTIPANYTGANLDTRTDKSNDIHFSEVVGTANAVSWSEKASYRQFPALNQNGTFECGAFSARKTLGVAYATYPKFGSYIDFSSSHIYQQRGATAGMSFPEIIAAWTAGVTLQGLVNDNPKVDADTDNLVIPQWMKAVGESFRVSGGIYVPADIELIASVIQTTGKAVMILTYFNSTEWAQKVPAIMDLTLRYVEDRALRHFVTAVDFTLVAGKKFLVIEDSAWFGGLNQRLVSEEWVRSRVIQAAYPMSFKFIPASGARPTYDGGTTVSLQKCLQFDGEFPANVSFVESYGPITRQAVSAFQVKYGIEVTGQLGLATTTKLHQLFP